MLKLDDVEPPTAEEVTMSIRETYSGPVLDWLLEQDDPGPRYLALRDLLDGAPDAPELAAARAEAHTRGPIAVVLDAMDRAGYWVEPGAGYSPKYQGTVWSLILLAQLGASIEQDERMARACAYVLDHTLAPGGQFTTNGAPSGTADCLQGNLCAALLDLGCDDPRLDAAFEWMARSVTGEGIAPMTDRHAAVRYYAGKCGPRFACGSNNKLPCAWGGVKVMLAFSKWPAERRTPLIERAIAEGADFLFSTDPALADYPSGYADKPSSNWWKFGFPVFYVTDLLQNVEALTALGYGHDPRLTHALDLIRGKQDRHGRWALEYDYAGKTWVDFGAKKQPNKWVTLRALRVLKAAA
ncbi:MAG: nitrogen fixation protein NifH [Chloroflexi bacterium]|nr:nitrogen fixation protein NifH [Chloroflexota bacterium]